MADQLKTPPPANNPDPAADALAGTTVGRFAISKRLGAGGMGQVYGAEDTTLKRSVAIKRMAPQASTTEADRKRLLKEAQRASALNHPNIGAIYDVVEHGGELWLVMEYVEGETLRRRRGGSYARRSTHEGTCALFRLHRLPRSWNGSSSP